ncbi:MAG TPA: hypothetical protein VNB94_02915 [Mycobacteriales bacterium]|nr:hypothetical protein [Mycobacteriales bacterium]
MSGDFRVTTSMVDRDMTVTCEPCQDSMHFALSAPGFPRLLALFAGQHDHSGAVEHVVALRPLRLVPPPPA